MEAMYPAHYTANGARYRGPGGKSTVVFTPVRIC